jgi:hypothetical protein
MRRLFLLGLFLLTGCQNLAGPFTRNKSVNDPSYANRPDSPNYSITEQERRGRAMWGVPDETFLGGPRSGAAHSIMGNGMTNGVNTGR